jgi:hypothetical protein
MTEFFCSIGEARVKELDLFVPWNGPWYADLALDDDTPLTGDVTLTVGTRKLRGTVDQRTAGDFVLQRSLRVVAGAGQWGKLLPPAAYYDDPSVDRMTIVHDLARETGETFAASLSFDGEPLADHFVRRAGPASATLDHLVGSTRNWWVAPDGTTHVGLREPVTPAPETYEVLSHSPLHRTAVIACDDPAALWVGHVLTERFESPQTIREFSLHLDKASCRITAYLGGDDRTVSRIGRALSALLEQREAQRLYGTYRYRVYADTNDGTLSLQVVRPVSGLPDVLPVTKVSGISGAVSHLNSGEIVRVAFDEGDPELPYVANFPAGDPEKASPLARMSDMVLSGGTGTTIMFSLGPEAGGYTAPTPAVIGNPVVVPGVRYLVTFGSALDQSPEAKIPPTPLTGADPLVGYVASGSTRGGIE